MKPPLRIIHVEDARLDSELLQDMLKRSFALQIVRVQTERDLGQALEEPDLDLIISDFTLPSYSGTIALAQARARRPEVPFIFFSGTIGEEAAVDTLKNGATDYVLKHKPQKLLAAIERALRERAERDARTAAEAALRRREEWFRALIENALDITTVVDRHGRFVYNSPSLERVLGYSAEEMKNRLPLSLIHPDDLLSAQPLLERVISSPGETVTAQLRVLHKNGSWRHLELMARWFAAGPEVDGIVVNSRDITDRREAELRYKSVFENSLEGICRTREDWSFVTANPELAGILGYDSAGDLVAVGKRIEIHPEDLVRIQKVINKCGVVRNYQCQARRKDCSIVWLELNVKALTDETGSAKYLDCFVQDVTKRVLDQEALNQQAALLNEAHDAIVVTDGMDIIRYWNKGAERLYGWTLDQVLGRSSRDVMQSALSAQDENEDLLLKVRRWEGELSQKSKDGKQLFVMSRRTLLRDASGEPRAILILNSDITEKKQTEAQFLRAQRLECIGVLAGGIAHDLNNILAPVLMGSELLKEYVTDSAGTRLIETMENCARRGSDIVKQVLSFARGLKSETGQVNLKQMVTEFSKFLRQTFPVSIQLQTSFSGSNVVLANVTELHQVLLNLCVNARDAMPEGGLLQIRVSNVTIAPNTAKTKPEGTTGEFVRLTVADTGTGIPSDALGKIFEPFYTTKEEGKGTGLGLATVQSIVKRHGGYVDVETVLGEGTQFHIFLPAFHDDSDRPTQEAPAPKRGTGELVLVVDDETAVLEMTRVILEDANYEVAVASDGIQALQAFQKHADRCQLVITDASMPLMDGVELVRALYEIRPSIPVICTTGEASGSKRESMQSIGVQTFLPKPYSAEQIVRLVSDILAEEPTLRGRRHNAPQRAP